MGTWTTWVSPIAAATATGCTAGPMRPSSRVSGPPSGCSRAKGDGEMKVVLFCGGQGLRLREFSESIPKPMVPLGYRPILWHVMRYYAHYGHKDFILCLGHKA